MLTAPMRPRELGHPPDSVAPEPVLEEALKNWKQTHRKESVELRAQHPRQLSALCLRPSCLLNGVTLGK